MKNSLLAHLKDDNCSQLLEDHLLNVAKLAKNFAYCIWQEDPIAEKAYLCGLLHDLGKCRTEFQEYLRGERNQSKETNHAIYGAGAALSKYNSPEASLCIAGHHAGLHNLHSLAEDIRKIEPKLKSIHDSFSFNELDSISIPKSEPELDLLKSEMQIRMLFSCLIQADWQDTAVFGGQEVSAKTMLDPTSLLNILTSHIRELSQDNNSPLQEIRSSIFDACMNIGKNKRGIYSLTVPTGGGKTLSMMAFALQQAKQNNLQRVIVVIPYLSIIEQNAQVYRNLFGDGNVIEHHSSIKTEDQETKEGYSLEKEQKRRWFVEAWDAPIVVTTSVQFIESLFSCKPGRCRKLRNIANSVILFDEAQLIPQKLLEPILDVLRRLVDEYGCSILFSSATQPSFTAKSLSNAFPVESIHEITPSIHDTYTSLSRVTYHKQLLERELEWDNLAQEIIYHDSEQILAVINMRKHAFALHESLKNLLPENLHNSIFHLSSAMCAEHRSRVLGDKKTRDNNTIHGRLNQGLPCYLISTQLVEAGVDIDFPIVYRALAPLDSLVQAAGRCNREGKQDKGDVYIFKPAASPSVPSGLYKTATDTTAALLNTITPEQLACDPTIFEKYFNSLYQLSDTGGEIQKLRKNLRYRDVDKETQVIEQNTIAIIVPYQDARTRIRHIRETNQVGKEDYRFLQRYTVNVYELDYKKLLNLDALDYLLPWLEIPVLQDGFYHETFGLLIEQRPMEDFIL